MTCDLKGIQSCSPNRLLYGVKFLRNTIFVDWPSTSFRRNNFRGSKPGDFYIEVFAINK